MVFSLLIIAMATMLSVYSSVEGSRQNTESMIDEYQGTLEEYVEASEEDLLGITVSAQAGRPGSTTSETALTMDVADEIEELEEVDEVIPIVMKPFGDFESMFEGGGGGFGPPEGFDPSGHPHRDLLFRCRLRVKQRGGRTPPGNGLLECKGVLRWVG